MRLEYSLPKAILNGSMDITNNLDFVREMMFSNNPNIRIVSLDEDNILPTDHPLILGGTCLLPPMDALIAEADGDEQLFDNCYGNHFNDPFVTQFVGALIIFLHNGGNIIFFCPELDTNIGKKFLQHFWVRYGIQIGIIDINQCSFDYSCIPIWLTFIYMASVIHPFELLYFYPEDAMIPNNIMDKLLMEISPVGTYEEKVKYILDLRSKLKNNPNTIVPLRSSDAPGFVTYMGSE